MSTTVAVREPAWSGLKPGLPILVPADPATAHMFARAGIRGRLSALRFGRVIPHEFFRLESDERGPLLLKCVTPPRRSGMEEAEAIAAWLAARGVPVSAPIEGWPQVLPDGRRLFVHRYIDGRRAPRSVSAMESLGRALAALHEALSAHTNIDTWRAATRERLVRLDGVRRELASGRLQAGPDPQQLRMLSSDRDIEFVDAVGEPARPLHGDCHPGNVLLSNGQPVFLDFEDVRHSVLATSFELALVIERFVLVRERDPTIAIARGQALLRGYGGYRFGADPVARLRALAMRSLCVLAEAQQAGTEISRGEWIKFFQLERAARERAVIVRAIFEV